MFLRLFAAGQSSLGSLVISEMFKNLAVLVLLCAAAYGQENEGSGEDDLKSREITLEEFEDIVTSGSQLVIDVREPEQASWDSVGAKKYVNIPLNDVDSALDLSPEDFEWMYDVEKPGSDSDFVFISEDGIRSEKAVKIAEEMDFKNARHLAGGSNRWLKERPDVLEKMQDEEIGIDEPPATANSTYNKDEL